MDESTRDRFDDLAMRCWRKEISFDEFFREAMPVWRGHAHQLMRRWRSPADFDDVLQEMRIRVWQKLWGRKNPRTGEQVAGYDPSKGRIGRYLIWGARVQAKTWIHQERGANKHGTRDKNPSRYALPFSSFEREGDERPRKFEVPEEPIQERVAEAKILLGRCRTAQDRAIIREFVASGGCVEVVAARVFPGMKDKTARKLVLCAISDVGGVALSGGRAA